MNSSSSKKDRQSHWNLLRMGMIEGPGGSCWVLELFLVRIRWLSTSRTEMQLEMRMQNS